MALAYVILSTLPCSAFLIAGAEVTAWASPMSGLTAVVRDDRPWSTLSPVATLTFANEALVNLC